jgi:glycosyltransferase involved in cell wall biosynthesis
MRIAFSWNGLPQYAARLLRAALDALDEECVVIGSRPTVPIEGMEAALGQSIVWIDSSRTTSWAELGLDVPAIFFQSGWGYPAFNALGNEVKRHGGKVIGFSDANFRANFRQLVLGGIWFRLKHSRRFDAMIVPGRSGERLMRYFGMPKARIFHGMYGADPALFPVGPPLSERPQRFLFVGQFIPRKDVTGLARAFLRLQRDYGEASSPWQLAIFGGGEQEGQIARGKNITISGFVQPEALGEVFREARFLVLPSLEEAWGLVVHEAALSGCGLILSDAIGSADDLAQGNNTLRFRAGDEKDLYRALASAASLTSTELETMQVESLAAAARFGPTRFRSAALAAIAAVTKAN